MNQTCFNAFVPGVWSDRRLIAESMQSACVSSGRNNGIAIVNNRNISAATKNKDGGDKK